MSWKELYERYDEFKDLTEEELIEKLGTWWGPIFFESKEDIRKGVWRRPSEEASGSKGSERRSNESKTEEKHCGEDHCEV